MTRIQLNGKPLEVADGSNLEQLVATMAAAPQSLATAVNQEFVARDSRAACVLRDGDEVFTFQPITGG
jgi:sulfur carrier protein